MNKINNTIKKNSKKIDSSVTKILKEKKSIINDLRKNLKNKEQEFIIAIKDRSCFQEHDWFWFENKNWKLTTIWAIDALNNFNDYWWEENTAHDQWFLTWYETAIQDINKFSWKNNNIISTEEFMNSVDNLLYFKDILQFQLILESNWVAKLDLTNTPYQILVRWDREKIKFYKKFENESSYEYLNNYLWIYDTIEAVYKISETIWELDEKWTKECKDCWWERISRIFDIDWTNLEEVTFCKDCWEWRPYEKED